eukprot:scaffold6461_cov48-Attheya_sp.AAC.6
MAVEDNLDVVNEETQTIASDHTSLLQIMMQLLFQKVMFWSLVPAVLVVPVWMVVGRELMGGPGGWGGIILMWTVGPVLLLYHFLLLAVLLRCNKRVGNHSPADFCVSVRLAKTLVIYYAAHFFLQIFMDDGGDQGNMGSWAVQFLGLKSATSDSIDALFAVMILVLLIVLMVFACMDDHVLLHEQDYLHHHLVPTTESSSVV